MSEHVPELRWVPREPDLAEYARVSQDASAIHLDAAVAQREGLPGVIVHGMHLFGQVVSHLHRHAPEGQTLASVDVRFVDVALPGTEVTVTFAAVEPHAVRFEGVQGARPVLGGGTASFRFRSV